WQRRRKAGPAAGRTESGWPEPGNPVIWGPEHDPEKWKPVFGADHAQAKTQAARPFRRNGVAVWRRRSMRSQQQMDAGQWGQLLLLGVLWGASFFFARVAVAEIAPLTLVALRVMIAATALNLWLLLW